MPESAALENARALLAYWEKACAQAREAKDVDKFIRCENFKEQCRSMVSALEGFANIPK